MPHEAKPPFYCWAGPRKPKVVFVGEAWGAEEDSIHQPFIGEAGKEFWRMLGQAIPDIEPELWSEAEKMHRYGLAWVKTRAPWLEATGIAFTNAMNFRPPDNKFDLLCGPKKAMPPGYSWPAVSQGKYVKPEYLGEVDRLHQEILEARPNLVVPLGNKSCWAILRTIAISSIRGTLFQVPQLQGLKALPTYHPAAILRQWEWRTITIIDLAKAWRECQFPEIIRPQRQITVNPSIEDCERWTQQTLASSPSMLSCDIETGFGQIKCVGFARSKSDALVIPFVDLSRPGGSYWSDAGLERRGWECVRALLESPITKVFQNGMYDLQYLLRMGFSPRNVTEDTMLLHHSIFPEMLKSLGFLGSVYTNERNWKVMRKGQGMEETEKRDE